jgi:hypothetical protein
MAKASTLRELAMPTRKMNGARNLLSAVVKVPRLVDGLQISFLMKRREGFNFIGIEREAEYVEIAQLRIAHAIKETALPLFDERVA